jgi:hypothetical protein
VVTRAVVLLALLAASCYAPSFPEGAPCSADDQCPQGQSCAPDGRCRSGGATDAPPGIDACVPVTETCNGVNDDCDAIIDEGFATGDPCDGPDVDQCTDDYTICDAAGAIVCGNTSGDDNAEVCNLDDDDCDGATDEGFDIGGPCDGPDGDACLEGTLSCDASGAMCTDDTGTTEEVCDQADNDCDASVDEGFDLQTDVDNCGDCGRRCFNTFGSTTCTSGVCAPICNTGAANCDNDADNGCELTDVNPTCDVNAPLDFQLQGDFADSAGFSSNIEQISSVLLVEQDPFVNMPIAARITLTHPPGADYDLVVHCQACAQELTDADDIVEVGRNDQGSGSGEELRLWIEVRLDTSVPQTACVQWNVNIQTATGGTNRCGG